MLQWAYCFVFIWYTHIAGIYKVPLFTFMKDSLSLYVSNIHKQDKGILLTVGSLPLIACDPGDLKVKVYSSLNLISSRFLAVSVN